MADPQVQEDLLDILMRSHLHATMIMMIIIIIIIKEIIIKENLPPLKTYKLILTLPFNN